MVHLYLINQWKNLWTTNRFLFRSVKFGFLSKKNKLKAKQFGFRCFSNPILF